MLRWQLFWRRPRVDFPDKRYGIFQEIDPYFVSPIEFPEKPSNHPEKKFFWLAGKNYYPFIPGGALKRFEFRYESSNFLLPLESSWSTFAICISIH